MDRQGPPNRPRYQLTVGLNRFRQQKRYDDVILSGQEGSTMLHLANAQYMTGPAGGNTGWPLSFGGPVCAKQISNCPLGRVLTYKNLLINFANFLTYKNLIYLLILQICMSEQAS